MFLKISDWLKKVAGTGDDRLSIPVSALMECVKSFPLNPEPASRYEACNLRWHELGIIVGRAVTKTPSDRPALQELSNAMVSIGHAVQEQTSDIVRLPADLLRTLQNRSPFILAAAEAYHSEGAKPQDTISFFPQEEEFDWSLSPQERMESKIKAFHLTSIREPMMAFIRSLPPLPPAPPQPQAPSLQYPSPRTPDDSLL